MIQQKTARKIAALVVLTNLAKLSDSHARKEFSKINDIEKLMDIFRSGLGYSIMCFALPVLRDHKDCTIDHLYALFIDQRYADYQSALANTLVERNDLNASYVLQFIDKARSQDVGFHIINQLGRNQAQQALLIDVFTARKLHPYYQQRLAREITRHPLAYKYHDIFSEADDIYIRFLFATAIAKTATDATSDDLFQIFTRIKNTEAEVAFVKALCTPDGDLLFRILTQTVSAETRTACAEKMLLIELTSCTLADLVSYCAAYRNDTGALAKRIISENYARMPVKQLLDMLWGLKVDADDICKQNIIYEILQSRIDELSEIAGIAQK